MARREELTSKLHGKYITRIQSNDIRHFVLECLEKAPARFYTDRASFGHHQFDERGESGLLLHTLRVLETALKFCTCCDIKDEDRDIFIASAILHDLCKYGVDGEYERLQGNHAEMFEAFLEKNNIHLDTKDTEDKIVEAVFCHMGVFGFKDSCVQPEWDINSLLIFADFIASQSNIRVEV